MMNAKVLVLNVERTSINMFPDLQKVFGLPFISCATVPDYYE